MRLASLVVALSLILLLIAGTSDAGGAKKKAKKLKGTIVSVEATANSTDSGFITVKTGKKGAQGTELKIEVTSSTKIESVKGKKGDKQSSPATFSDLAMGKKVLIYRSPGSETQAASIAIIAGKKSK